MPSEGVVSLLRFCRHNMLAPHLPLVRPARDWRRFRPVQMLPRRNGPLPAVCPSRLPLTAPIGRWFRGGQEGGAALIEFCLLINVFLLMAMGVCDFAIVIEQGMVVTAAARAGAEYGASEGNFNDLAGMQTAAANSAKTIASMTATATSWCACTAGGIAVSCASTCSAYSPTYPTIQIQNIDQPIHYVQVHTAASMPVLFGWVSIPLTVPLAGNSIVRSQ
jgi:Flp pilus assembly protein TadG